MNLVRGIRRFSRDEAGVTALEYGILAAVVAVVIGGVFSTQMSTTVTSIFSKVSAAVTNVKTQ
ncbi:Flp pilus assembly protein, pilin Flp [Pandoraea terrae]|uniref:Flp pilus assembly protein, pilin Flp n=1 Tax=Pandoraea terrae TaxID=1537710 RepID=A0A5E4Z6V3_9BURK|nr:Flp family type IVb pilin [Pandoraea terrae]VVE56488.1 Flp pilus assembly protein, pilin Flp [Pandoraea terrae]